MSKNFHWNSEKQEGPLRVCLLVSRNKDNKEISGFKERRKSFVYKDLARALDEFQTFSESGLDGEVSRMYISVNSRDEVKVNRGLVHYLIDHPEFNLSMIQPKIAGLAMEKDCAAEKNWLFDFDDTNEDNVDKFRADILAAVPDATVLLYPTPHGYAVVVDKHFDTRELLEKYPFVTLKRDDMLLWDWRAK